MMSATVRAALVAGLCAACVPTAAPTPVETALPGQLPKTPAQVGKAAWYGGIFQGRRTANGETYDMHTLTAAHRRLPLGSVVQVTNLANRRSVVVRINDRGPWQGRGRIIDLSYAASRALGMGDSGVARVRLDPLPAPQPTSD